MYVLCFAIICRLLLWGAATNVFKTVTELKVAFGHFTFSHSEDPKSATGDV